MANPIASNIFVGAETGLLKGISLSNKSWVNLNSIECADKENEITSMCWGNAEQTKVCLALRNKTIVEYDTNEDDLAVFETMQKAEGVFKGLAKYNNTVITCTDKGILQGWADESVIINTGGNVKKMCQNPSELHMFATGGEENDLKLWDMNRPEEAIFKAKNVKNDFLSLRMPVCVMDIGFFQHNSTIVVGTGNHQVRIYDPNCSQRRPVFDMEYDEYPITALSIKPNSNQVVVGNTKGNMATLDLRMKGSIVNAFKGVDGSIRSIQCHATQNLVASCGLDRFMRVHDMKTKKLKTKFYLKSRLNCLLFADKRVDDEPHKAKDSVKKIVKQSKMEVDSGNASESEEEEIWDKLESVETKKAQKRKSEECKTETDDVQKKVVKSSKKKKSKTKTSS